MVSSFGSGDLRRIVTQILLVMRRLPLCLEGRSKDLVCGGGFGQEGGYLFGYGYSSIFLIMYRG